MLTLDDGVVCYTHASSMRDGRRRRGRNCKFFT